MGEGAANMVILAPSDNVGIALRDIPAGNLAHTMAGLALAAEETIPQGHKIALANILQGALILRFGVPIAVTTADIPRGRLVHVHNVASRYLTNDEDHYE